MYLKSDFKEENRIGSFGYTFPTGGQKKREELNQKTGIILVKKRGQFSYQHGSSGFKFKFSKRAA